MLSQVPKGEAPGPPTSLVELTFHPRHPGHPPMPQNQDMGHPPALSFIASGFVPFGPLM